MSSLSSQVLSLYDLGQVLWLIASMSTPLHLKISETLRHQIEAGHYLAGAKLPSEHQLMAMFQVSRITVRQAIANLVNQGLARTHRGKGAFVTPSQKVAYSLSSPLHFLEQDLAQKGILLTFENLVWCKVKPPPEIRTRLQLSASEHMYLQKKLLRMNGAVGAVDVSYLLSDLGQRFTKELQQQMTFPLLEQHDIPITQIDAVIECTHADPEMSSYLEVPLGQPLIVYRHIAYSQGRPILQGETISRADRFCYALTTQRS